MHLLLRVESAKRALMLVRSVPAVKGYKYFVPHTRAYKLHLTLSAYYANYQVDSWKSGIKILVTKKCSLFYYSTSLSPCKFLKIQYFQKLHGKRGVLFLNGPTPLMVRNLIRRITRYATKLKYNIEIFT